MAACLKLVTLLLVAQTGLGCKYFCKNPVTKAYDCCDDGNPYLEPAPEAPVDEETVTYPPGDSTNCYYFCGWEDSGYCCHEADSPLSPVRDHSNNGGTCPEMNDMICMESQEYNLIKHKPENVFLKNGSVVVPQSDDRYDVCASDGYCLKDERCCANPCVQRHTCVKALPGDEETEEPSEVSYDGKGTGCYYNCVYNEQVYCCHEVDSPYDPNRNHNDHSGECPTEEQMSCLSPQEYDLIKEDPKEVILTNGTVFVSEPRDKYDVCASDGYCMNDEKCCPNPCAKRHTCVKALDNEKSLLEKEPNVKKTNKFPGLKKTE
ncbi:uncharacterized protein LOC143035705 [Oratosquilla oratoria]|uniref:uncharacterized protein LOC143035705 n=1 Tax=Oratosquilla oratoria TaxID=337810 RepID=UPI003F77531B